MHQKTLNWLGLPKLESDATRLLNSALGVLAIQITKFEAALTLIEFCDERRRPLLAIIGDPAEDDSSARVEATSQLRSLANWKQIAARDGAITLYNFAGVKQSIDGLIGKCSTLQPHIVHRRLKAGRRIFEKAFPTFADIRFSVAHAGLPFRSPEKLEAHRVPGMNGMVFEFLNGRTLISTVNGKEAQYSLTSESLGALTATAHEIFEAFQPAADVTRTLPHI